MAYNPYQFGYMYPQFQQQANPQGMTPPTIHADIIQIGSEQEAWNYPAGQIMMARDESAIYIKSTGANGTPTLVAYERRAQRPQEAASDYVTRKEFKEALEALQKAKEAEE